MKYLSRTKTVFIALSCMASFPALAAVFVSDDFHAANLDTQLWTVQDPVGGATYSIINNELAISIPGGLDHDLLATGNNSTRVMQPTDDVDFEIEVKYTSLPTLQYQMQGVLIEQDINNYIRFDFFSDGANLRVYTATYTNGLITNRTDSVVSVPSSTLYMRIARTGIQWHQSYSIDGVNWTTASIFNQALVANSVGPFVGNAVGSGSPAYVGVIDYFFNTASPIVPEDGGIDPPDMNPPILYNDVVSAISDTEIQATWNTDEPADSYIEYGLTEAYELGQVSDATLTNNHTLNIPGLQADTTYQVRFSSTDASNNTSTSENYEIYTSALPVFDIWYGSNQTFGAIGQAQEWINVLGNVTDPDGIAWLTYSLNGQPAVPLSMGPSGGRLDELGDFNADISFSDLVVGPNTVLLTAEDNVGNQSTELVTINYPGETHLALDYSVDWSVVANIQDVSQIVDGLWSLEADKVRPLEIGFDRLIAVGDVQWQDYEVTVPVTAHALDPICAVQWCPGGGAFLGVGVRWQGHYPDADQPYTKWFPLGSLGGVKWNGTGTTSWMELFRGSDGVIIEEDTHVSLPLEVPHMFRLRAKTTATEHHYEIKLWPLAEAEPAEWNFTIDEQLSEISSGSVLLVAHHIDASFGEVIVTQLDNTPPVMSDLDITTTANSATITWQTDKPATSEVAVGWSSGYELGTTTDETLKMSHSVTLPKLWPGLTYHYQFSSTDSEGNTAVSADMTFVTDTVVFNCNGCHQ